MPTVAEVSGERAISREKQSAIPALAIAEQFDVDGALYHTQEAEMHRGLKLGEQALKARGSFEQKRKEMVRGSRVPNSWFQVNEQKNIAFTFLFVFIFPAGPTEK